MQEYLFPNLQDVKSKSKFNYQKTDNIEWAKWSWNPFTGCIGGCEYCYARDIAERFYPHGFKLHYYPERLEAPFNTSIPAAKLNEPGIRNVFLGSMTDFFGENVPFAWIEQVLDIVRQTPQWNYLILTKNPDRICGLKSLRLFKAMLPENVWLGATVDVQARVVSTENAFAGLDLPIKFVSCEPLREAIRFDYLDRFDWLILGGQSANSRLPAMQPEWPWVESLLWQAREADCKVYMKPNLTVRPKEYPTLQLPASTV